MVSSSTRFRPKVHALKQIPVSAVTVQRAPLPAIETRLAPAVPLPVSENLESATPVTLLLNVTSQLTVALLVGLASPRLIELTTGKALSIVYAGPVTVPFPTPVPPSLLPKESTILSLSTNFKASVPDPLPVLAVNV